MRRLQFPNTMKKGNRSKVRDYRGVTVTPSLYKIDASVLADRLREKVEKKALLYAGKVGFRSGMGVMDSVYTPNYLVTREVNSKGGKLVAFFVDLKVAFDTIDRGILIETMRKMGVREGLFRKCEETLREMRNKVCVQTRHEKGLLKE